MDESRRTILLAEDDESVRNLVVRFLEGRGYEVVAVVDGLEALRRLEDWVGPLPIVVTDNNMPRMTGVELVDEILENPDWEEIQIVMQSALRSGRVDSLLAKGAGRFAYLDKGDIVEELPRRLAAASAALRSVAEKQAQESREVA